MQWCAVSLVVRVLNCQSRGCGFKPWQGEKFRCRFLLRLRPLANSAMMSTMTARGQWEDETVRERTCHRPHMMRPRKESACTLSQPKGQFFFMLERRDFFTSFLKQSMF